MSQSLNEQAHKKIRKMKKPTKLSKIGDKDRLEGRLGWRILKIADHRFIKHSNAAGHLVLYAWELIERMDKVMGIDRFFEILEDQASIFMETAREDSLYCIRRVKLDKRKTYDRVMEKIEISGRNGMVLGAIFPPSILKFSRKIKDEQEKVDSDSAKEAEDWQEDPTGED